MKYFKFIKPRIEEYKYKKGVNRLDTDSGEYKTAKVFYFVFYAWFMLFQAAYLFSNTVAFISYQKAAANVDVTLFITSWVVFVAYIAVFVLLKSKKHLPVFILNTAAGIAQMIALYKLTDQVPIAMLEGWFNNRYFWMHYIPAILMILVGAFICFIGFKSYFHFRKDYSAVLALMLEEYKREHGSVSDTEWENHLKTLEEKYLQTALEMKANTTKRKK